MPLINLPRSRNELIFLLKWISLFLLIFFVSSLRRLQSFDVFWIEYCHSDYSYLALFIFFWTISIKILEFMTFKITIILFIFHFGMRALVVRLRIEIIIYFINFFKFIEITNFVRLMISIKLIIKEFIIFTLIIAAAAIFALATQNKFLHNDFK